MGGGGRGVGGGEEGGVRGGREKQSQKRYMVICSVNFIKVESQVSLAVIVQRPCSVGYDDCYKAGRKNSEATERALAALVRSSRQLGGLRGS